MKGNGPLVMTSRLALASVLVVVAVLVLACGGRWVFVMHGPNGANYANESVFREIQLDSKIVIEHVVKPSYKLTMTEVAAKMRPLSESANEQNLDRLEALLASESL